MAVISKSKSLDALRTKVSAAVQVKFGSDGPNGKYTWVQDIFPDKVVYSLDGCLYSASYSVLDGKVTFGEPTEVETAYKTLGEASRTLCAESDRLSESAYDSSSGELTMTIIKPGFNKGKGRYYPASVLKRDYNIFEGAKMFADHQTDAEAKSKPEGSVNNWVASVKKPWVEADGTVKAKAAVIDPPFKAKLEELNKQGLLSEMGVSIRAIGAASPAEVQGTKTNLVESLVRARSVDFVTYAGAGGAVEVIEANNDENDVDLITEAQLRERRPDLINLVESSHSHKEGIALSKTLEQQLQEATAALTEANTKITVLETKVTESETKLSEAANVAKKATASTELTKLLTESKLPEKAQDRIRAQFKEAIEVTGMKEAIDAEKDYIKSLGVKTTASVSNMGAGDNENHDEADKSDKTANLVESFKLLGMDEKQAKIAANAKR